jgi:hypothetical protein
LIDFTFVEKASKPDEPREYETTRLGKDILMREKEVYEF